MKEKVHYFFNKYKLQFLMIIILTTISNTLSILYSYFYKYIIDTVISNQRYDELIKWVLSIAFVLIINTFLSFFIYSYYLKIFKTKISNDLRKTMFKNLTMFPISFFKKNDIGSILIKLLDDTRGISDYISLYYFMYISNTIRFIITFTFLFNLNKLLAFIVLISTPVYYLCVRISFNKLEFYNTKERQAFDTLSESIKEKIQNIKTIKIFSKESMFKKIFDKEIDEWFKQERYIVFWNGAVGIVRDFITSFMPIIILIVGVYEMKSKRMSLGDLIAFIGILGAAYIPVTEIIYFIVKKHNVKPFFQRNEELLQCIDVKKSNNKNYHVFSNKCPKINLSSISFSYNNNNIFNNFNLHIEGNGLTVLKGENGRGKSTLFNIIFGLYNIDNGEVNINANNKISFLTQENSIFKMSLRDNILLEEKNSSMVDKLINEFNLAKLDNLEFISHNKLSGGEQRKICIARVLKENSSIYLLDEPTENLDIEAKRILINYLNELKKEKLIIVSSHDKEIDSIADKIIEI